jgi:hypothetical protein
VLHRPECIQRACGQAIDGRDPWQLASIGPQQLWTKANAAAILVSRPAEGEAEGTLQGSDTGPATTSVCFSAYNTDAERPAIYIVDEATSEPREVNLD